MSINCFVSIFDHYEENYFPFYHFDWKPYGEITELVPSEYLYSGLCCEVVNDMVLAEQYYILQRDRLISIKLLHKDNPTPKSELKDSILINILMLINPRILSIKTEHGYGFTLASCAKTRTFICQSRKERENWFNAFGPIGVFSDLEKKYKLGALLGKGSFSEVYRAIQKSTGKPYAIKIVNKYMLMKNETLLKCTINEVLILRHFQHPRILSLIEIYETRDNLFLVIDFLSGGELTKRVSLNGRLCEKDAALVMRHLLEAVSFSHAHGVIHRDIKLGNILLKSNIGLDIKLIDFRLSIIENKKVNQDSRCGSPGYMAPEMFKNEPIGKEIDVYSCGIVMFILLSGYPPFAGMSRNEVLKKNKDGHIYFSHKVWNNISQEAKDLIKSLTSASPNDRPSAEEAFADIWFRKMIGKIPEKKLQLYCHGEYFNDQEKALFGKKCSELLCYPLKLPSEIDIQNAVDSNENYLSPTRISIFLDEQSGRLPKRFFQSGISVARSFSVGRKHNDFQKLDSFSNGFQGNSPYEEAKKDNSRFLPRALPIAPGGVKGGSKGKLFSTFAVKSISSKTLKSKNDFFITSEQSINNKHSLNKNEKSKFCPS